MLIMNNSTILSGVSVFLYNKYKALDFAYNYKV